MILITFCLMIINIHRCTNTSLEIMLMNVNEYSPIFTKLSYEVNMNENNAINTTLKVNVKATDKDNDVSSTGCCCSRN